MYSRGKISCLILGLMVVFSLMPVNPAHAKFRDVINFEDNNFVGISQVEVFHSYTVVNGNDVYDGSRLSYQVTTGMMTNYELGVNLPVIFYENGTQGVGDAAIFQRFKFSQEDGGIPESSGGFELILPTGKENVTPPTGTDRLNARLFTTVGHSLGKNLRWLLNGSVTIMGDENVEDLWEYNGGLRYQPSNFVKFVGEVNGMSGGVRDETRVYLSPGAIFRTEGGLNIMFSTPFGMTEEAADYKPTFQFAYEF